MLAYFSISINHVFILSTNHYNFSVLSYYYYFISCYIHSKRVFFSKSNHPRDRQARRRTFSPQYIFHNNRRSLGARSFCVDTVAVVSVTLFFHPPPHRRSPSSLNCPSRVLFDVLKGLSHTAAGWPRWTTMTAIVKERRTFFSGRMWFNNNIVSERLRKDKKKKLVDRW